MKVCKGHCAIAAIAALTFPLAACGGNEPSENDRDAPERAGVSGGEYVATVDDPTYLAPASNCYETECFTILDMVNDPLVSLDSESGELDYDGLAESIEPNEEQTVWTVTLKEGRTFHNGEPVDAEAFARAWNYSQNPKNKQATAGFMARIQGAGEAKEMAGFSVVDERTFEVTLNGPFSQFGQQMSYAPAFAPIAQECMDDVKACNEQPIGTGPYMMDGPWQHDEAIKVIRWEDYAGEQVGQADKVTFQMFTDPTAAFRDFQNGGLDVIQLAPEVYLEAKDQYGDAVLHEATANLSFIELPTWQAPFDDPNVRRAISMAIDRQLIIDKLLHGLADPATDIVTPPIPGSRDDACGYCVYDPEQARQLLADSGVDPQSQTLKFSYGGDETSAQVPEAVARQVQENLGFDYELQAMEWAQFLQFLVGEKFQGPFFLGWSYDYASPENYIRPIVGTSGDANFTGYSSKVVDDLLAQGDRAAGLEEGISFYQQAGDAALDDMPIIPLWNSQVAIASSDDVDDVRWNGELGIVDYKDVTVVR